MSREGCMGKANSLEKGRRDYWTAKRSAAKALLHRARGSFRARAKSPRGPWACPPLSSSPAGLRPDAKCRRARGRDMDEHVFAAIVAGDETKSLGVVEPLHLSDDRNCSRRIRRDPARPKPIARAAFAAARQCQQRPPQAPGSPALPWRRRRPGRAIWRPQEQFRGLRRAERWRAETRRPRRPPTRRIHSPCRP